MRGRAASVFVLAKVLGYQFIDSDLSDPEGGEKDSE